MMNRNTPHHQTSNILYSIIVISILMSSVAMVDALGVAPSKKIIEYDPDTISEQIITSRVINNEGRDIAVRITAGGELSEYVTLNDPLVYLSKDEPETEFTYTLNLPQNLSSGSKSIWITVNEIGIGQQTSEGSSVGGFLSVSQQLQIDVPHTGKYAEGYLSVYPMTDHSNIMVSVNLVNKGTESIESFNVEIKVKDTNDDIVYSRDAEYPMTLDVKQSSRIEEHISLKQPGAYILEFTTYYADKNLTLSQDFSAGKYDITIADANVQNFRLGTIAKFDISLMSGWNGPIDGVYGEVIIKDNNGTVIDRIRTDKKAISSKDNSIFAYWDTSNVRSGEYLISMLIYAGDKVSTREYRAQVADNSIIVQEIDKETSGQDNIKIVIISTIILAIIIMAFSLVASRHKGNRR